MEHFDYQDPGTVPESYLLGSGLGDSDISGFAAGLNGAVGDITAEDNALIAEYGPAADTDGTDAGDQTFSELPGQPDAATLPADPILADYSLTDYGPATADALAGWNVADGIEASDYENFEAGLTSDDADAAIADASAADATSDD